eukprot:TRINITY_DN605_c0_g1_i3.p1 TRINITY_DN605_c0_g1~~TRINITY_DN605_c0_g1_i3.p1  ORF type:complete len:356 (+),score=-2.51 TRINITY_DN605_c0_g1_i3:95-1069(+)
MSHSFEITVKVDKHLYYPDFPESPKQRVVRVRKRVQNLRVPMIDRAAGDQSDFHPKPVNEILKSQSNAPIKRTVTKASKSRITSGYLRGSWIRRNQKAAQLVNKNILPTEKSILDRMREKLITLANNSTKYTLSTQTEVKEKVPKKVCHSESHKSGGLNKVLLVSFPTTQKPFRTLTSAKPSPIFLISTKNKAHINQKCSLGNVIQAPSPLTQYRKNRGDDTTIVPEMQSGSGKLSISFNGAIPTRPKTSLGYVTRISSGKSKLKAGMTENEYGNVNDPVYFTRPCVTPIQRYKTTKNIKELLRTFNNIVQIHRISFNTLSIVN